MSSSRESRGKSKNVETFFLQQGRKNESTMDALSSRFGLLEWRAAFFFLGGSLGLLKNAHDILEEMIRYVRTTLILSNFFPRGLHIQG